jgi:transposase-like protein
MPRTTKKIDVTCQNSSCSHYLIDKGKNIVRNGTDKTTGRQKYFCKYCKKHFRDTTNTPLYNKHLPLKDIIKICKSLAKYYSGYRIVNELGFNKNTVYHLIDNLVAHPEYFTKILLEESLLDESQIEAMWCGILRRKKTISKETRDQIIKIMYQLHCKTYLGDTTDTPLYNKYLSPLDFAFKYGLLDFCDLLAYDYIYELLDITYICELLAKKCNLRSIVKRTGHKRNTICYLIDNLVTRPKYYNETLLEMSILNESQIKAMWATILRTKKTMNKEKRSQIMNIIYSYKRRNKQYLKSEKYVGIQTSNCDT